jgi:hypothetical protein
VIMECTKCHKVKSLTEFSYRNKKEKIYYLYCDDCRKETLEIQKKYKDRAVEDYNLRKELNVIECKCGISFVCFRDFHMYRHINSIKHKKLLGIDC